jgi:acetyltransferase
LSSTAALRWPRNAHTCDGIPYRIRPIEPTDTAREHDFIQRLSTESRYLRFMHDLREPSADFIRSLVEVDRHRTMALVAVHGEGPQERIIAVARYAADADGQNCEFAVAVADDWQCRGIATTLTPMLFEHARREGYRTIYGTVMAHNQRMIDLAVGLGLEVETPGEGQDTVRAWRSLN